MSLDSLFVIIVEDEPAHAEAIQRSLRSSGSRALVRVVASLSAYRQTIAEQVPDIVLLDMNLPDGRALEVFADAGPRNYPIIVMTSYGSEALAVEVLKAGALDYVVKSAEVFAAMPRTIERTLREWHVIQEHRQAMLALHASEERFRGLLQDVDAVAVQGYYADGTVFYWNRASENLYGYTRAEVMGRSLLELIIPADIQQQVGQAVRQMCETCQPHAPAEILLHRKDRSEVTVYSCHAVLCPPGSAVELYCIDIDISKQKDYEQQLEHQATHDILTGLANRALLRDRLDQAIHQAQRAGTLVAVLLLDLDRFKMVNDSFGHTLGDELLCQAAQRLKQSVREVDTVARFGGDEFIIVLTEITDVTAVNRVANKVLHQLTQPFPLAGRELSLSASMGISLFPQDSADSMTLIRFADIAMYQAKGKGGAFSYYAATMNLHTLETLELESDLRHALERQEFCLHYQPKVDLGTGCISSCEALLRWQHPQRGLVSPGQFIPLAEETGLIVAIGSWALGEACRQSLAWQSAGLAPICIAVNLSARQFRQGNLANLVSRILADSGLDPAWLELELTESMIMDDPVGTEQTLRELKQLGLGLSLDDFGTGYSSLNYLRRFPVDSLKIDRSFIQDVASDPSGASVVTSIVDIAHNLNLTAIAEGVETAEQLDFLMRCGCDTMQGFLFSKPLPAHQFAELLYQGRTLELPGRAHSGNVNSTAE